MRSLVIGYGSIGSRHARVIKQLGWPVAVVSKHRPSFKPCYKSMAEALKNEKPELVVIASVTAVHKNDLARLAQSGFKGTVLVEKPLFLRLCPVPRNRFKKIYVAYNLRFHPLLSELRRRLRGERVISVQAYVGKDLKTWRPANDYRRSYSASRKAGGGALRDLSHELDYLQWLFGGCISIAAAGGHFSDLKISSDDTFALLLKMKRCPIVSLQMNYLDRPGRRQISVNTNRHTFFADLLTGEFRVDGRSKRFKTACDLTYREQFKAVARNSAALCDLDQGLDVLKMIEAAEKASTRRRWVAI